MGDKSTANCVLVGLGQMGWRYDVEQDAVLTHAKAISQHAQLQLIAAVDPNAHARAEFSRAYPAVPTFGSLADVAADVGAAAAVDWIILALPTQLHFAAFNEALSLNPKVIICEKPLATSFLEAREMQRLAEAQGVLLFVNYIRPHEPGCMAMFQFVSAGTWGGVEKIIVRYGKGIANNASHFIQLLVQAFGAPQQARVINANDKTLLDPEPDFILDFGDMQAVFLRFDYQLYAISEMDIYLQQGAIFYRSMGQRIDYCQAQTDGTFSSVKRLELVRSEPTELNLYQRHALAYYYSAWQKQNNDAELMQSSLEALRVVENIRTQLNSQDIFDSDLFAAWPS